jgi:hypothetical protein
VELTPGVISNVFQILPVTLGICFWRYHVCIFDGYMKTCWNWIFLLYALSDLKLSKMTLRDLGPQALVSRSICYQQHKFRRYELGQMDGRTQRWLQVPPKFFRGAWENDKSDLSTIFFNRWQHTFFSFVFDLRVIFLWIQCSNKVCLNL